MSLNCYALTVIFYYMLTYVTLYILDYLVYKNRTGANKASE